MIGTEAVFVVSLDELNVPVAVYSWPAVAVPFDVAYCTATVSLAAGASVTVKSSVVSSPSVASASASAATATDSFRPSLVQIAPVSVQVALGASRERASRCPCPTA